MTDFENAIEAEFETRGYTVVTELVVRNVRTYVRVLAENEETLFISDIILVPYGDYAAIPRLVEEVSAVA